MEARSPAEDGSAPAVLPKGSVDEEIKMGGEIWGLAGILLVLLASFRLIDLAPRTCLLALILSFFWGRALEGKGGKGFAKPFD